MDIFYDKDTDISIIKNKKVAVFGFGSQGHAHSLNMMESGVDVTVVVPSAASKKRAADAGLKVADAADAVKAADVIMMLVPDELCAKVYRESVEPGLTEGKALAFAHGFNVHYNQITPPAGIDVFMVAPKSPGHLVRSQFEAGSGVPMLIAIAQDASGKARDLALSYAAAIGGGRAGIIETTFGDETETDLFGEQVILCGGVSSLIKASFETLVEGGYPPEMAYFECVHELKLIVDLIYEGGITNMRYSVSNTAQYGDLTRGPRIVTSETKAEMKKILTEIQDGSFAREWILENQANCPTFKALTRKDEGHLVEKVGAKLRSMMPWLKKKKLVKEK
jgi:ketol-acid reductoisomerase